jgi:hypothetical protein
MEQLKGVLESLGGSIGPYVLRVVGALVILLIAWLVSRLVRAAVGRALDATGLDTRLRSPGISAVVANVAYWLVWLLALPALLGALQLEGLLGPVNTMLSRLLGFLPNLVGALIVFGVGFLVARIVREVVTGLLTAAGSERLAARLGLTQALGKNTIAGLIGSIAFVLVLLPTLAAALQPLGLDSVMLPVSRLLDTVIALIPRLASAAIIIVFAAIVGRALAGIVTALLAGMGFNGVPSRLGLPAGFRLGGRDASELAGVAVMAAVLIVAVTQASEVLGFPILTETVAAMGGVLARVAVAGLVLGLGLWLGSAAMRVIAATNVANAAALGRLARAAIAFFSAALALRQAGLPSEIVTIAFGSVVGAIAIGVAVAVGVGGRHVAARLLEGAVASFEGDRARQQAPNEAAD